MGSPGSRAAAVLRRAVEPKPGSRRENAGTKPGAMHAARFRRPGYTLPMENKAAANQDVKKLGELIKDIKFAMLTTVEPDGSLHSRPMATQEVEFDGDLWFFTGASTAKVDEV